MNAINNPVTDNAELICSAMIEAKRIALLAEKLADLAQHIADNPDSVDGLELADNDIGAVSNHINGIESFYSRLSTNIPLITY